MATSASSHSRVNTESTLPPLSTTSAGRSPLATAIHSASMRREHSAPATTGRETVFDHGEKAPSRAHRARHRDGLVLTGLVLAGRRSGAFLSQDLALAKGADPRR